MRMKHQRSSTPAPKCNGYTDSLLSVEVLPFAPQHLPSLPAGKQSCTDSKAPVSLSTRTENVEVFSISTSDSQKSSRRRRLARSFTAFAEIEEVPKLPELSSSSVYDSNENHEESLMKVKVTGSQFNSLTRKTERLQRCYTYPTPPSARQKLASAAEASSAEHLPSLHNSTKSVPTLHGLENKKKEAIREYVENAQRNFDVGASKAIMFDNWIKSQQENCQAR